MGRCALAAVIAAMIVLTSAGCRSGRANVESMVKQADGLFNAKKYNEAYALYNQALQRDSKNDRIMTRLGECCLELKEPLRGLGWVDQAIAINPGNAMAWEKKAELVMAQVRLKESIPLFQKALALDGKLNAARLNLALVYEQLKRFDEALALGREAVALEPKVAETHYKYAVTLELAKRFDEAEDQYRQALSLDKRHVRAMTRLSNLLIAEQKNLGQARTLAQEANKLEPGDGDAALLAAWALFLSGDKKSACNELEQVARAHPSNWQAWARLAMALEDIGDITRSKQAAKIAASIAPRPLQILSAPGKAPAGKAPPPAVEGVR
jgi:tetratricopeptide (TPR) repeat protein